MGKKSALIGGFIFGIILDIVLFYVGFHIYEEHTIFGTLSAFKTDEKWFLILLPFGMAMIADLYVILGPLFEQFDYLVFFGPFIFLGIVAYVFPIMLFAIMLMCLKYWLNLLIFIVADIILLIIGE